MRAMLARRYASVLRAAKEANVQQDGFANIFYIVIGAIFVSASIPAVLTLLGGADQTDWDPIAVAMWVLVSATVIFGVITALAAAAGIPLLGSGGGGSRGGSRRRR